jgi:hypothetical protein
LALVGDVTMTYSEDVTTSVVISGTPGATISISVEGHILPDRELARVTLSADGTASATFSVAWEEFIFARAQARYMIDGVVADDALSLWSLGLSALQPPA